MKKTIVLVLVSSILLLTAACRKAPSGGSLEGKIHFLVGNVTLNGTPAAIGAAVKPGDVIETKQVSSCEIIVAEKNILLVAADSRLVYDLKPGDGRLELSRGRLGALLRNKLPFGEFTITMPTVTASIRGTAFFLAAESDDRAYACVCNGRIAFNPVGGREGTVAASHHKAYYYTKKKGAVEIEEAGLKYHSDAAMDKEAATIGEKIDWSRIE